MEKIKKRIEEIERDKKDIEEVTTNILKYLEKVRDVIKNFVTKEELEKKLKASEEESKKVARMLEEIEKGLKEKFKEMEEVKKELESVKKEEVLKTIKGFSSSLETSFKEIEGIKRRIEEEKRESEEMEKVVTKVLKALSENLEKTSKEIEEVKALQKGLEEEVRKELKNERNVFEGYKEEIVKILNEKMKTQDERIDRIEKGYGEILSLKPEVEKKIKNLEKRERDFELSLEKRFTYFIKSFEEWEKFAKEVRENFEKTKSIISGFDEKFSSFKKDVEREIGEIRVIREQLNEVGRKIDEMENERFVTENEIRNEMESLGSMFENQIQEIRKLYLEERMKEIFERIIDLESKILALQKVLEEVKSSQTVIIE